METHVLLPRELCLTSPDLSCSSPSVARLLEQRVGVTVGTGADGGVAKGTRFHPAQGTVRCGRIEVYSTLPLDDVSTV